VWKPSGWAVLVSDDDGAANAGQETVASMGARRSPLLHEWLAQRLGARFPIACDANLAHGLLHRLDRETSGVLLWAKSQRSYYTARVHFVARRVRKEYLCLCCGMPSAATPRLLQAPLQELSQLQLGRPWTIVGKRGARPACTELLNVVHLFDTQCPNGVSLLRVRLHTGRRHQIRAHLSSEGHPLLGDGAYGAGASPSWCPRILLHACAFTFDPGSLESGVPSPLAVEAPLPEDLCVALAALAPGGARERAGLCVATAPGV